MTSYAPPLVAVAFCLLPTLTLAAQRTFVGATGTDNPSCSLQAPCRSFGAAITATSLGGEVIVQDSAGYGTVTITKSVSIIAPPGVYAGISVLSGDGVTINAPGATVVLRGLTINGQGGANGILAQAAARVRIESCVVSGMGGQGIYHHANNAEMIVLDTISRDNGDGGLALVAQDASLVMDHVRSERNQNVGLYLAPVAPASYVRATISNSVFANNGTYGVWADSVGGATTLVSVEGSVFTDGIRGFFASAAASGAAVRATLTRNTFNTAGSGIYLYAILPGTADVHALENSTTTAFLIDGTGTAMYASGNSGATLNCSGFATLFTLGNNNMGVIPSSCNYVKMGGS